jgi:hypothetical protein
MAMPALAVPNAGQLRLVWTTGGAQSAINVLGVVNSGNVAITQAIANTVGAAVKAAISSSGMNARLHTSTALAAVGLRDVRSANQPEFLDSGAAVAGTGANNLMPPQTCLVVTERTANAGKRFRGRVYLSGFDSTQNTATGAAAAGTLTSAVAFITAIKSALVASGLDLGVISRPNPAATPPDAGFISTVTLIQCRDAVWDTQRRRAVPGV